MGGQDHGRLGTGVQSNARLTGATSAVLLVLLAVEGATLPSCRLISMRLPSLKEDQGLPAFEGSEETLAREILGATKRGPWSQACNTPPFRPLMQSSRRRQEGGRPRQDHWRC